MTWTPNKPYNELPLLPPAADLETVAVLKAVAAARVAVAELNQAVKRIPNPNVLINTIPLLEAQASSEIENIVTTTDELFRYADAVENASTPEVKETLRYRAALFAGIAYLQERGLTAQTAVRVCSEIKNRDMGFRSLPGTCIGNSDTKTAIYTPPVGQETIKRLLANWEKFIHARQELDPLIILAAQHYQFETIHPFADGNGRTGRIINVLLLLDLGLLEQPVLYLSRYIIRHKQEYYDRLKAVTACGAWESWVLFMLEAVRESAADTLKKLDAIQELQTRMREQLRNETSAGANSDLLDVLFEQPYTRITKVADRCGISRQTATKWLKELVAVKGLSVIAVGREKLFINHQLLDVLQQG